MKNYEYPTWLVSLDIAQELKEIGFDEPCTFAINYTQYIEPFLVQHINKGYNVVFYGEVRILKYETLDKDLLDKIAIIPTWTDVLAWFRKRGLYGFITFDNTFPNSVSETFSFEIRKINRKLIYGSEENSTDEFNCYEEAREALVKALIRTYKQEQPINENE
jgi:hypothetical protein